MKHFMGTREWELTRKTSQYHCLRKQKHCLSKNKDSQNEIMEQVDEFALLG